MRFWHRHKLVCTGREIYAVFGKDNLPGGAKPVQSLGDEMKCACGSRFIRHHMPFSEPITPLLDSRDNAS
jgi:hypothetical protein